MKRLYILAAIAILCQTAFSQKKYEMVVEKTDGTETVINVEDVARTYFRERGNGNNTPAGTGEGMLKVGEYTIYADHAYWGYSTQHKHHVLYFTTANYIEVIDTYKSTGVLNFPPKTTTIDIQLSYKTQTSSLPEGDFIFAMTATGPYAESSDGITNGIYFGYDPTDGDSRIVITKTGNEYTIKVQNMKVHGGQFDVRNQDNPYIEQNINTAASFEYTGPITTISESYIGDGSGNWTAESRP